MMKCLKRPDRIYPSDEEFSLFCKFGLTQKKGVLVFFEEMDLSDSLQVFVRCQFDTGEIWCVSVPGSFLEILKKGQEYTFYCQEIDYPHFPGIQAFVYAISSTQKDLCIPDQGERFHICDVALPGVGWGVKDYYVEKSAISETGFVLVSMLDFHRERRKIWMSPEMFSAIKIDTIWTFHWLPVMKSDNVLDTHGYALGCADDWFQQID